MDELRLTNQPGSLLPGLNGVATPGVDQGWKLWIYTNYDCNLRCDYCVVRSSPDVPRRAIGVANALRLVDEAVALGFSEVFFTGGEPFILPDVYDMLAYSSARIRTSVLTNATLLRGSRLEKLSAINNDNLIIHVSLDGATAAQHDAYRGKGSWEKAVEGIASLLTRGFTVWLSTTETPANSANLDDIRALRRSMGIPDERHLVRPLARRGNSREGLEVHRGNLAPEITANLDGIFWHPLSTDADMQVSNKLFPLADAVASVWETLEVMAQTGEAPQLTFR